MSDPSEPAAKEWWIASTPIEGTWHFTLSETAYEAMNKLSEAIIQRRVLCYPIDNPITAVRWAGRVDR